MKDVTLEISSVHEIKGIEPAKTFNTYIGQVEQKSDKLICRYEPMHKELMEDNRMLLEYKPGKLQVLTYDSNGSLVGHLKFALGERTDSFYPSPVGRLEVEILTRTMELSSFDGYDLLELEYKIGLADVEQAAKLRMKFSY